MWDTDWPRAGSPKLRMHVDKCTFGVGTKQMCFIVVCCFQQNISLLSFYPQPPLPSNHRLIWSETGMLGFCSECKKSNPAQLINWEKFSQPVSSWASSMLLFLLNASVVFYRLHWLSVIVDSSLQIANSRYSSFYCMESSVLRVRGLVPSKS